jgi:hypothetical protein
MMQKISQQNMDGPSGGGMFIMLRILWVFLIALGLSTRALNCEMVSNATST